RQRPRRLVYRHRQIAGDVRQRHVHHGRVEHFHERGEHHRHGDDPRVDLTLGHFRLQTSDFRLLTSYLVYTVRTTDMPGRSLCSVSGAGARTICTGTRCATFTKSPVAFSGGGRLTRAPAAGAMLSMWPSTPRPP